MRGVDRETFYKDHIEPGCELEQRQVAFNSGEIDSSTSDPIPVWEEATVCITHDVAINRLQVPLKQS